MPYWHLMEAAAAALQVQPLQLWLPQVLLQHWTLSYYSHHPRLQDKWRILFCVSAWMKLFSPHRQQVTLRVSRQPQWWLALKIPSCGGDRIRKERLPDVARLACVYLELTSVPSERLFIVAGKVVSDHRSALLLDSASISILKYNAKLTDK